MKNLKMIVMALMAILMSVSFVACDSDDDNNVSNANLTGKWYCKTDSLRDLLIINADNSVVVNRVYNYQSWESVDGNIIVNGDKLNLTFENGNSVSGTFAVNNNSLVIYTSNGTYTYTVDYENSDGDDVSTGATKTVTVDVYPNTKQFYCSNKSTAGGVTTYTFTYSSSSSNVFNSGSSYKFHHNTGYT